jgi:hypothetical protein
MDRAPIAGPCEDVTRSSWSFVPFHRHLTHCPIFYSLSDPAREHPCPIFTPTCIHNSKPWWAICGLQCQWCQMEESGRRTSGHDDEFGLSESVPLSPNAPISNILVFSNGCIGVGGYLAYNYPSSSPSHPPMDPPASVFYSYRLVPRAYFFLENRWGSSLC